MNSTYIRTWLISILTGLLLANSSCGIYAQFKVNGKSPAYDASSQTYLIAIPQEAFEKDYATHITIDRDTMWSNLKIDGQEINEDFTFQSVSANKQYALSALDNGKDIQAYITFTYLPILNIKGTFGYDYVKGTMSLLLPNENNAEEILVKAKWRGGSTNTENKHKRNYKIKTIDSSGKSKDYSFLNMRNDNNWILDAGQVDMFRMRNRIATELWNDFATKPYYASNEPKAKTGVDGKVIEVILNNEYRGIYSLTEAMDRKELKLKKYDEDKQEMHGQLWKASGYGYATFWEKPGNYDNNSETWNVFETKYPDIDDVCPTDYSTLWEAINFVATSDNTTFCTEVADYFDIPVLVDYYIFLQVVNGIDNIGKNMYWAVYDKSKDKKLTLAIWDLDATVGQNYTDDPLRPDMVNPTNRLSITALCIYERLIQQNVDNFKEKVYNRYKELRRSYLAEEELLARYQSYYELVTGCGAAIREENKWSYDSDISGNKLNIKEEYSGYITEWLKQRLSFLDEEFEKTTAGILSTSFSQPTNKQNLYNLLGQKIQQPSKGVYILAGKKYIRK